MLKIDIISVQPKMFEGFLRESIVARAVKKGACAINVVDLREFGEGRWRKVDDRPYGGGPGMLMKCGPWFAAVESCLGRQAAAEKADGGAGNGRVRVVMTSPAGKTFTQRDAEAFAALAASAGGLRLVFLCGHYEGFDARIETLATDKYSLGDFVMTGGELAAAAMVDATVRLLPGVLGGGPAATASESFGRDGLLEAPQYTHPPEFRGMQVPEVLLSGNHARIEAWRRAEARKLTERERPDLV
ncbi:MAG: tRNA (guanosine(37)-N1)-methyltransferase TrmD [Kiritimatiellia bacterium]